MAQLGVVEIHSLSDHSPRHEAVRQLMQLDRLVFERAPQALYEEIVHEPAVHGSLHRRPWGQRCTQGW